MCHKLTRSVGQSPGQYIGEHDNTWAKLTNQRDSCLKRRKRHNWIRNHALATSLLSAGLCRIPCLSAGPSLLVGEMENICR